MPARCQNGRLRRLACTVLRRPTLRRHCASARRRPRATTRDHGTQPLQNDHREPLRRARTCPSRWCCRTAAACRCRRRPRSNRRAHLARPEGARRARRWARWRAPTSTTTSISPAARGASLGDRRGDGRRRRARPRFARARAGGMWRHQRRSNRAQHRAPLRRLQRVLPAVARPAAWSTRARISSATTTRSTTRRRRSSTTSAASCASRRASASSTSAAAGAALIFWAARELRRRGAPASRCRRTSSTTCSARSRARGLAGRVQRASCATTSTCPRTRSTTRSRASACSSTSASRASRKYFGKIYRVLKPGGFVLNHGITHNALGADEPRQRHRRFRRGIRVSRRRADARVAR